MPSRSACRFIAQPGLELGVKRIVAREHVVERQHGDRFRALLAQEIASPCTCVAAGSAASACPTRSAPPNGATTPNVFLRFGQQPVVAPESACGLRGTRARAPARRCDRGSARAVRARVAPQSALRAATRLACERRITPSSMTLSPLAASVAPVVVMSTISSAVPAAGAPSVAPALSTMR